MNESLINDNLIINSEGEFTLFHLNNHGEIKYTKYDPSNKPMETLILHKNNALRYAVTIDNIDNIHLIVLTKLGELSYYIYKNNTWSSAIIAKFDLKSNLYNNIDILKVNENINIIYNYANLINSKLWTIQHVIENKKIWDKQNIASLVLDKSFAYFHIDIDFFNTIHLLYSSIENNIYQVYHTFYNSYAKKWNPNPQRLSLSNTNAIFPYLFVDTQDNLHAVWLEKLKMNYKLKYCKLNSKGNEKHLWEQKNIPHISNCNSMPIIAEEKGKLKIIYLTNQDIRSFYSTNYGNTWYEGDTLEISPSKISIAKVSENLLRSSHIKINHAYCTIDDSLYFYFLNSINQIDIADTDSTLIESKESTEPINILDIEEEIIAKLEKILENQKETKIILDKTIDSQNKIEEKLNIITETLNREKDSLLNKLFRSSK